MKFNVVITNWALSHLLIGKSFDALFDEKLNFNFGGGSQIEALKFLRLS